MKYSLINGERSEAQPGLSGKCQICSCPSIAKCGEIRIWHWAHKGASICDPWWETEAEWHRTWKNCFPDDWQEFIQYGTSGEIHMGDVKTTQGWVIEFQRCYLKPEECRERTAFYKKLVWVVDGTRRTRDKEKFVESMNELPPVSIKPQIRLVFLAQCALLKEWSDINAPVFFDFGQENLWCLLPTSQYMWGFVASFSRLGFVKLHSADAEQVKNFEYWLNYLNNLASQYALINADRLKFEAAKLCAEKKHLYKSFRSHEVIDVPVDS